MSHAFSSVGLEERSWRILMARLMTQHHIGTVFDSASGMRCSANHSSIQVPPHVAGMSHLATPRRVDQDKSGLLSVSAGIDKG